MWQRLKNLWRMSNLEVRTDGQLMSPDKKVVWFEDSSKPKGPALIVDLDTKDPFENDTFE